jgi:alkylation response protein AidB-like acyl-CoA dehydrogenase
MTLAGKGWLCPSWPKAHGGLGLSPAKQIILTEEYERYGVARTNDHGIVMLGPLVIQYGTEAQKQRFLPKILTGEHIWCQGYSEPGAGSDLAALRTEAVPDGDDYVVNGQKIWTTLATDANWIFLLVRTDKQAKKQEGISFLLCDMKTPGITVRPIITIEGGHEVNEVFFDDVKIPLENLVGQENRGWDCAKFLLGNERFGQARVGASRERIRRLKAIASTESMDGGQPLMQDPDFARKVTEIEIELKALEMTVMRVIATESKRKDKKPDPATSVLKIKGTEIQQMCSELLMKAAGPYAWVDGDPEAEGSNDIDVAPDWAFGLAGVYFNWRKQSIYGGSNEIQRNIMAKAFLGL